jgi:hypothetical protein
MGATQQSRIRRSGFSGQGHVFHHPNFAFPTLTLWLTPREVWSTLAARQRLI